MSMFLFCNLLYILLSNSLCLCDLVSVVLGAFEISIFVISSLIFEKHFAFETAFHNVFFDECRSDIDDKSK